MSKETTVSALAFIGVIVVLGGLGWAASRSGDPERDTEETGESTKVQAYEIREIARGLSVPWAMAFTSEERILVTERSGRLRVIENGQLLEKPLHVFSDVAAQSEAGLMGLAVDPDYSRNKYVYVVYAYGAGGGIRDKVVRFTDEGDSLSNPRTILDNIPAASNHAGSRIKFGPDGKLYVTTGDATDRSIAQDRNNLGGKILRANADGSVPSDNPFPGSPVWSYGHRNPQGIGWSEDGDLYASEHGPSGFDGPGGGDEINHIQKGENYGWPLVSHENRRERTVAPLTLWTPAEAPSGLLVYSGKAFPQWKGNIFVGALRGTSLWRLTLEGDDTIVGREEFPGVSYGRIREVVEGPDGAIYFSTSNRDGRGNPAATDDRIFAIVPKDK